MMVRRYLIDDSVTCPARVVDKIETDVNIIRLDRTIFHPTSGSQRSDRGKIDNAQVLAVELNGDFIDHYVDRSKGLVVGGEVLLCVDRAWRNLQCAYHTAGHFIVHALSAVMPECRVLIGQHWPDQAVITCSAKGPMDATAMKALNDVVQAIIVADLPITTSISHGARYIRFGNLPPMVCTGTHLRRSSQLQRAQIIRSEFDSMRLRLHYTAYCLQSTGG